MPPKMKGPGYEIKDKSAAIAVGQDLEILGMSLRNAPQYLEDRPLKHQGFGNVAGDSQKAAQELALAIDSLINSLGYAQNVIDETGAAIKNIMTGYDARESDARSSFRAEEERL